MEQLTADVTDSRDIISRIDRVETDLAAAIEAGDGTEFELRKELNALDAFATEASGYAADWRYGETIIHADYFVTYAEELAHDIGAVSAETSGWPNRHIDWEAAADELKQDYSEVEFEGETYYIR